MHFATQYGHVEDRLVQAGGREGAEEAMFAHMRSGGVEFGNLDQNRIVRTLHARFQIDPRDPRQQRPLREHSEVARPGEVEECVASPQTPPVGDRAVDAHPAVTEWHEVVTCEPVE
ncbi:Uncharacterised protein [Mycobacteroides abscessus subsp. abscessus]|nr:Uncharacterised protein [Mycobacteroides abscessus subsp. abscessus]